MLKRFTKKFGAAFGGNEKWITFVELSSEKYRGSKNVNTNKKFIEDIEKERKRTTKNLSWEALRR